MKRLLNIPVLTLLFMAASSPCIAMVSLADVSRERAKEMGVTLRSRLNGEAGVALWLEFKTQGELKNFTHADVRITAGGKSLVHAYLMASRPTAGSISVYFSADPAWLATSVLTIVMKNGERTLIGYQFKVKDFIEWTAEDIAGLSLELTDPERVESLQFKAGGRVLMTLGSKAAVTAPIYSWKLVEGRLQILNGGNIYDELTVVARDASTLVAKRRDGTVAKYRTVGK